MCCLPQRTANKEILWAWLAVRGLSHATQQPFRLDEVDELLGKQGDQVCCRAICMHAFMPHPWSGLRRANLGQLAVTCM